MYCVSIEFGRMRNAVDSTITRWKSRNNLYTVLNQSARVFALGYYINIIESHPCVLVYCFIVCLRIHNGSEPPLVQWVRCYNLEP